MRPPKHPDGIIIILAVLVIATILASAAVFANLIIANIQQTRLIDQSIQARYWAESGIEHGLYQVRKREAALAADCDTTGIYSGGSCSDDTGYCTGGGGPETTVPCVTANQGSLPAPSVWQTVASREDKFDFSLGIGQAIQVDLFNALQAGDPFGEITSGIGSVGIEWENPFDLYATLTKVNTVSGIQEQKVTKEIISQQSCLGSCVYTFRAVLNQLVGGSSYTLRLEAFNFLTQAPGKVRVTAYSDDDLGCQPPANPCQPLAIPGRYVITSTGDAGRSLQRITVRTPARPPLSGLFDFVLFSEEEVVK